MGLGHEEGALPQSVRLPGDIHHKLSQLLGRHRNAVAAIVGAGLLASIFLDRAEKHERSA